MASDPKIDRLKKVALFKGSSDKELGAVANLCSEVDITAGQVIAEQGKLAWECVIIVEGEADVTVDGDRIGSVGAGEVVGELGLLTKKPRTATVTAKTPIKGYVISGQEFEAALDAAPEMAQNMLREMADRLADVLSTHHH